jgi:hypothetical protein
MLCALRELDAPEADCPTPLDEVVDPDELAPPAVEDPLPDIPDAPLVAAPDPLRSTFVSLYIAVELLAELVLLAALALAPVAVSRSTHPVRVTVCPA